MIVIGVTGSRFWRDPEPIGRLLDRVAQGHGEVLIRHGKCPPRAPVSCTYISWNEALRMEASCNRQFWGADWLADRHADLRGWEVKAYPADWASYRNRAGMVRNAEMVKEGADVWLGFLHPDSRGTVDCLNRAQAARIPILREYESALEGDAEEPAGLFDLNP